jgi:NADP-dependent alcohol dehydrogenase
MKNFVYQNPVKIYFGEGQIANIAQEIPKKKKVLITYGGGSIKKNGVYAQIVNALKNHDYMEFGGIEPNPEYKTLMRAVELIRKNNIEYILAAGGGSVIDGTKFIAAAVNFKGDPWDILSKNAKIKTAIPFGTVLTLPATASEMNCGAVVSRREGNDKLFFVDPKVFPKFSILDPTTTYSLPKDQTCNGIVDIFVHVTEQYLTYEVNSPLQDRFAEGILRTLIEETPKVLQNPNDYNARANIMWCSTMALNGIIVAGVLEDWATHRIGHELTACFDIAHGPSLALIHPALLTVMKKLKKDKLDIYAKNIWNIDAKSSKDPAAAAIAKTKEFFSSIGMKTRLRDVNIGVDKFPRILEQLKRHGYTNLGEKGNITLEVVEKILKEAE